MDDRAKWLHNNKRENIGFVHFQTPANTKAIQNAACVERRVRREQKYHGACKLLTKAGDNVQPENCETDSKQPEFIERECDCQERDEESRVSALRIKDRLQGKHTELEGSAHTQGILQSVHNTHTFTQDGGLVTVCVYVWGFSRLNQAGI